MKSSSPGPERGKVDLVPLDVLEVGDDIVAGRTKAAVGDVGELELVRATAALDSIGGTPEGSRTRVVAVGPKNRQCHDPIHSCLGIGGSAYWQSRLGA